MRDSGPAVVLYETPGKNFQRVLTESTLEELQANLKDKLELGKGEGLELIQLWDGKEVDLVDDADFAAFTLRSHRAGFAIIKINSSKLETTSTTRTQRGESSNSTSMDRGRSSHIAKAGQPTSTQQTSLILPQVVSKEPAGESERNKPSREVNGTVDSEVKIEETKKKRKKKPKQEVSLSMDVDTRARIPTPEILKDTFNKEGAESEKTVVPTTSKRGKKRKLSTVGDAEMGVEVPSFKKATKKSKVKRQAESLASIPQEKGDACISGAVDSLPDPAAQEFASNLDSSRGLNGFEVNNSSIGALGLCPGGGRIILATEEQETHTVKETSSKSEYLPSQALPPWTTESTGPSTPLRESFSDQINESQYYLSPTSDKNLREDEDGRQDSPDSDARSYSEPSLYTYEDEVERLDKPRAQQSSRLRRIPERSPSLSGEEIPMASPPNVSFSPNLEPGKVISINSQDTIPTLRRARERGETASVADVGDQAFREILSQENRRFKGSSSQRSVLGDNLLTPITPAQSWALLSPENNGPKALDTDLPDSPKPQDPASHHVKEMTSSQKTLSRPAMGRGQDKNAASLLPSTQPSYPSLSSIFTLPNQPRTRSLSALSMTAAQIEEDDTNSDGSEDSDEPDLQIPSNRRAGAGFGEVKKRRGLFDYFKLS